MSITTIDLSNPDSIRKAGGTILHNNHSEGSDKGSGKTSDKSGRLHLEREIKELRARLDHTRGDQT